MTGLRARRRPRPAVEGGGPGAGRPQEGGRGAGRTRPGPSTRAVLFWCVAVVVVVSLVRLTLLDVRHVESDSMEPTVPTGSTVVVGRHLPPVRHALVEVEVEGDILLKRVVAMAGQTVAIEDAVLVVDGVRQSEPYVDLESLDGVYFGPVTVPAASVFVLGDNRGSSIDSRDFGAVPVSQVRGAVIGQLPF